MKKMFIFAMVSFVALSIVACSKDYADIDHTHDQYADTDHSHDQYADTNHTHNETQTKIYKFSIHFDETTGNSGDEWAQAIHNLPNKIKNSDAVFVYGKSRLWTDENAYDAWPVSYNMLGYNYTVLFETSYIAFKRYYNLGTFAAEDIAMRVIVIPAEVVVTAKAANVNVNEYMAMTAYLKSIGETLEVQTIE